MIKLLAKLRIIKLKRRKKERKKEGFDAMGHKQRSVARSFATAKCAQHYHRLPRSVIPLSESVGGGQAHNKLEE
jgi:hypothetical protein